MSKITEIAKQKKNPKRYNVYVDNQFFAGVSDYLVLKYQLKPGKEIEKEKLFQLCQEDSFEKAREYAYRYLIFQPKKKVIQKLESKGYDLEIVNQVVQFFEENHYIDDAAYAKRYAQDSLKNQKKSKRMTEQLLFQKGISKKEIEKSLESIPEETETKNAKAALEKKFIYYQKKSSSTYELKGKLYQYLMRKGFPSEIVQSVINQKVQTYEDD